MTNITLNHKYNMIKLDSVYATESGKKKKKNNIKQMHVC